MFSNQTIVLVCNSKFFTANESTMTSLGTPSEVNHFQLSWFASGVFIFTPLENNAASPPLPPF